MGNACDDLGPWVNMQSVILNAAERSEESNLLRIRDSSPALRMTMMTDPMTNQYYVYIMTNKSRTLYTGVTNNLERRVYEHKQKLVPGFTTKYNISQLIYFEATHDIRAAIEREKQIKGWLRSKKVALIESVNPTWADLSARW